MEETISGHLLKVNGNSGKSISHYMHCLVTAKLADDSKPSYSSKCCADAGAAENFASQQFMRKLGVKVKHVQGKSYDFRDTSQNKVEVVGEQQFFSNFQMNGLNVNLTYQ